MATQTTRQPGFAAAAGGPGGSFLLSAIFSCALVASAVVAAPSAPGTFVVRLRPGAPVAGQLDLGAGVRASIVRRGPDLAVVTMAGNSGLAEGESLRRLRAHPAIRLASPNYATAAAGSNGSTPNDPYFPWQWNLSAVRWERIRPILPPLVSTRISILDTGLAIVDWTDPATGRSFARVPDLDRVRVVPGWDFVDSDDTPWDENQHGTHVASVIAATANNALGIAGLLDTVELQPVRVLNDKGTGSLDELVAGLDWVAAQGTDVVNLSLVVAGTDGLDVLVDALDRVLASGAVIVAAAGNSHGNVLWPAAHPGVLSVGAVRSAGCSNGQAVTRPTIYTSWGPRLDVVAPGGDNAMDVDHDGYPDGIPGMTIDPADPTKTGIWLGAGTSFSSAHVSAVAVVLRGLGVPGTAVRQLIIDSADDIQPPGWDVWTGGGLVDPWTAVNRALTGSWSEPRSFDVAVELSPLGNDRTSARLTVRDASTGATAAGVTVYGHWTTASPYWQSDVSDRNGGSGSRARPAPETISPSWSTGSGWGEPGSWEASPREGCVSIAA